MRALENNGGNGSHIYTIRQKRKKYNPGPQKSRKSIQYLKKYFFSKIVKDNFKR